MAGEYVSIRDARIVGLSMDEGSLVVDTAVICPTIDVATAYIERVRNDTQEEFGTNIMFAGFLPLVVSDLRVAYVVNAPPPPPRSPPVPPSPYKERCDIESD